MYNIDIPLCEEVQTEREVYEAVVDKIKNAAVNKGCFTIMLQTDNNIGTISRDFADKIAATGFSQVDDRTVVRLTNKHIGLIFNDGGFKFIYAK